MNKFYGFKESIFNDPKFNPPAKVRSISPKKNVVKYVCNALLKLLGHNEFKESFLRRARELQPLLFPDTCGFVCEFLKTNGIKLEPGIPKLRNCGTEGCIYYFGDKVLKCTFGKEEAEIAKCLKGNRDIVPVIDVSFEPQTEVYLILSWKLNTNRADELAYEINRIGHILGEWFDDEKLEKWNGDQEEIKKLLNIDEFLKYNERKINNDSVKRIAVKIFQIIVEVYHKSNFLVGSDVHVGNVGFTDTDEPQMFDLGYPRKFGVGWVNKPTNV